MSQLYKRVLLKLSGEVLQNKTTGSSLDPEVIADTAKQLKEVYQQNVQICLVVGGGNIFRGGIGEKLGINRSQGDYMGMLATVINSLALQSALEQIDVPTRVMTAIPIPSVAEPFIRRKAISHLEKGNIVIFAAGTGNPYFTTDTAAALRATEVGAQVVVKGTKVDGVYTADPRKDAGAQRYDRLSYHEAISRQLKVMDTAAFSLCMENNIPIIVFNFFKDGEFRRVVNGEPVGTLISHS